MNRKSLALTAVLLASLGIAPADVAAQKKKNINQAPAAMAATAQDYYLIQNQKSLTGELIGFNDASRSVSVRLDFPEWVPNPKYRPNAGAQHALSVDYNRLQQEAQRLQASRNAAQAHQHYNAMMNLQARIAADMARANNGNGQPPFVAIHHTKDFDFDMQENISLRKMFLPQDYDDTGRVKEYSKEKLTELRGENKPKGSYSAAGSEFHSGQGVWVYLIPPSRSSTATAVKDKDKEDKDATPPRPTVKMLVIYKDGAIGGSDAAAAAKKKQ
jgi:hypothetical protein